MNVQFPDKFQPLFEPFRYKVFYGGRGGAKSWNFARALLLRGLNKPTRALCARETMKSLADSVHQLLRDQIGRMGLDGFYQVQKSVILGRNGTQIAFAGLKHNVNEIKSFEGADLVWVEEAQSVSGGSWDVLVPTIRKDDSEIWMSFNPDLETDQTYQRFVVNPPPGAVVVKVGWEDNPWFPDTLRAEMEHCRATDPDDYAHIWGGQCINLSKGAIYTDELRAADAEGRITRVPYDPSKPVHTAWDLGWGDYMSIWLFQVFPFEYRFVGFIQDHQKKLSWYLTELQKRGYVWGTDYLPHDGSHHELGTGKTIEELMRAAGRRVIVQPRIPVVDGINAARTAFPLCWFDREACADGIQALRHYVWGENMQTGVPLREPKHDENSHAADAFRAAGVAVKPPKPKTPQQPGRPERVSAWS